MNRVVLCGRLAERPRMSATATGLTLATLRLQVPRQGLSDRAPAIDEIECLAFDDLARQFHLRGEPGLPVNLEGWLLSGWCRTEDGSSFLLARVAVEAAYWLDSRETAFEPAEETPTDGVPVRAGANGATPPRPYEAFLTWAKARLMRRVYPFTGLGEPAMTNGKAGR